MRFHSDKGSENRATFVLLLLLWQDVCTILSGAADVPEEHTLCPSRLEPLTHNPRLRRSKCTRVHTPHSNARTRQLRRVSALAPLR